ncbi:MAG: DegT/DnrJ/EryC1/StrS family aminotransferase [Acidobacteria bacterium]|nr:DegT/DnrJ/EryC1/StrS family aminotransferase [Acidobacteriota bacterium]
MNISYFRPSIGEKEKAAVNAVLSSGWLTTGRAVKEFEGRFAAYLGVPHAVAVNSCTAALHLALEATGVRQTDIVLVPTMTFAATAAVVRHLGARPVLVDCDPVTLCIDPGAVEATARDWSRRGNLKALIPMHYGGQMADMDRLTEVSRRFGMRVIEDAAHALPAFLRQGPGHPWRSVGHTAPLTCFSFYANKCITTGEGGMVVTHSAELAERIRMMSLHGLSRSAWTRFDGKGSWYYEIMEPGFKYNLTDVAAAIGLAQLGKADDFWQQRQRIAGSYLARLAMYSDFLELHTELNDRKSSWHLYPIRLRLEQLDIDRAQFMEELKQCGITCSVHWMPLHLHPYYRRSYGYRPEDFPIASQQWPRLVSLPIYPDMTEQELEYVCDSAGSVLRRHAKRRRAAVAVAQVSADLVL